MSAPEWFASIAGWKPATNKSKRRCIELFGEPIAPNIADVGSVESLKLAGHVYLSLGVRQRTTMTLTSDTGDSNAGAALEVAVERDLDQQLVALDPHRDWQVTRSGGAAQYRQFRHLDELQRLLDAEPALRATVGHDYQVKSDLYVSLPDHLLDARFLHAAIACKWTIRSDRVQNVRHEFNTLVRSRRGRLPHLTLVTAEPLPTRVISIARGTGEVDAVYHVLFDELSEAVARSGSSRQQSAWEEMISQDRVRPYRSLGRELASN